MTDGLDDADLGEAARLAAEIFLEIYRGLESRRVSPAATPAAIRRLFEGTVGDAGVGLVRALEEFRANVLPNAMGTPHPLYAGLVNSSPLPGAALADLLVSALNNNGGAFHQSPAMTACEEEVVRAFARLFGFAPEETDGIVLPGGTFANLQGIVLARARAFPGSAPPAAARLYVSDAAHFSVGRSARVAGLADDAVVPVPSLGRGAMDVAALGERVRADRAAGAQPFAVVATAGTTGTGAIDPVDEIADLCAEERLWLHVDACYGGAAALVPALRPRLGRLERADSVAVDPHKWFFVPVTAALLLTHDRRAARQFFGADAASYIPGGGDDAWRRGIPTTRRCSGFAIWMALRAHGFSAIREAVERNVAEARLLERRLAEQGFEVLEGGELSVVCARRAPEGLDRAQADAFQSAVANHVAASGRAWFSTVRFRNETWLRFNFVNIHTRETHVDALAALVADAAAFEERNVRLRAREQA